jgi:hypothetical protein
MSNDNNDNPLPELGQLLPSAPQAKKVRLVREPVSQKEIDAIKEEYNCIRRSAVDMVKHTIELGRLLIAAKAKLRQSRSLDRRWGKWVDRNLPFKIRAAQRAMKAARDVEDNPLLLQLPPEEFIALVWGNEPKQLEEGERDKKGKSVVNDASDDDDEEDEEDDGSQSGGLGFNPGFFPEKGKPGFSWFKSLVGTLDREFFDSDTITVQEKLMFAQELIAWLEQRRVVFADRLETQERKEERKD